MLKKHTHKTHTPDIHINPIHTKKQHLRVTILVNNHQSLTNKHKAKIYDQYMDTQIIIKNFSGKYKNFILFGKYKNDKSII